MTLDVCVIDFLWILISFFYTLLRTSLTAVSQQTRGIKCRSRYEGGGVFCLGCCLALALPLSVDVLCRVVCYCEHKIFYTIFFCERFYRYSYLRSSKLALDMSWQLYNVFILVKSYEKRKVWAEELFLYVQAMIIVTKRDDKHIAK